PQNYTLNTDFNITGVIAPTFTGVLSGAGGISYRPMATATITFQGANTFGGSYHPQAFGNAVPSTTLNLGGTFSNVSSIVLEANQTLLLDNATTNLGNRVNDAAT